MLIAIKTALNVACQWVTNQRGASPTRLFHSGIGALIVLLASGLPASAQTYTVAPPPFLLIQDNSGRIVNGGCVWTYVAGTTTAATTYSSASGVANTNPIRSDSAGRFTAYLTPGQSYKFVYENIPCDDDPPTHGPTLKTVDNISAMPASGVNLDVTGTAGENITAGAAVYLADGTGGTNTGQWYNATSSALASSVLAKYVGVAVSAVTSGSSGSFRVGGRVTGLTSLTAGANYFIASGSGAMTATAPTNARLLGVADSTTSLLIQPNLAPSVNPLGVAEGRLTLTSGTPVTTGDVSAATSIYYTPYKGNRIALYDGAAWNDRYFTEITISVSSCTASKPYDIFLYDNAGTVTAEQLVWTNATTRATALTKQDGVYVKTGAVTRRYVGTYYCNASAGQTDDTAAKRYVWNYYNRVRRPMRVLEATNSWTYTTATWRQANGAAGNQLDFVIGVSEDAIPARIVGSAECSCAADNNMLVAIGLDSTTTPSALSLRPFVRTTVSNIKMALAASWEDYPGDGRHVLVWLEIGGGSATVTWYGDSGGTDMQSGIAGSIEG